MSAQTDLHDDEPPLDPAVERIRRKLTWLLIGSMGVMILGVVAVFAVILYRIGAFSDGDTPARVDVAADVAESIALPAGARIGDMTLDEGVLAVRIDLPDGRQEVRLFRIGEEALSGRIEFVPGGE